MTPSLGPAPRTDSEYAAAFGRLLLDGADISGVADDQGRFVFVNDAWTQQTGWTRAESIGRHFLDFIHKDDHPLTSAEFETIKAKRDWAGVESRLRTKSGAYLRISWRACFDVDAGLIYSTGRDVTADRLLQSLVEDMLEASGAVAGEDFFRTVANELVSLFDLDFASLVELGPGRPRLLATVWRPAPGAAPESAFAERERLFDPDWVAKLCLEARIVLDGAQSVYPEDLWLRYVGAQSNAVFRILAPDAGPDGDPIAAIRVGARGPLPHPSALSTAARLLGSRVATEIERARRAELLGAAEEKLRQNLEYSNALLRASPDLLFVMDPDFTIRDWFCQDETDLIMPSEKFVGKRMDELLPGDIADGLHRATAAARATGRPAGFEYRVVTLGGEKDFEARLVAPVNGQVLLVARDVTDRKSLEVRVIAASKMAALGEMAAALAHEINNPLAVIFGRSQQLLDAALEGKATAEMTAQASELIHRTADRIAKTVRALRSFARDGRRDPFEEKEVAALFEETLELCAARFRHHDIEIKVAAPPAGATVECRPSQISQILLNLLGNAFDAVTAAAERADERAEEPKRRWVRLEFSDLGADIELAVVDGGEGPPEDAVGRIMLPFFTTKGPGHGTGLGLSISRGIAEEHGGSLCFDRVDGTTRFRLRLPKSQHCKG